VKYQADATVLDFWYRGCGWCMRAMPQVNQLNGDFKDKPVAVIGLNTDRDVNDAKFVVDALGLNYTTLRIDQDTVSQFQVRGFPTMILIDPDGVVREFHVGYSPSLRADIGKKVQELLDAKKIPG
jgi:thiol-disulfide isomerase/thioredoxin